MAISIYLRAVILLELSEHSVVPKGPPVFNLLRYQEKGIFLCITWKENEGHTSFQEKEGDIKSG